MKAKPDRFDLVMRGINEGVYEYEVGPDRIYYSPRIYEVLGIPRRSLRTAADWRRRIHPEDLPGFIAAFKAHLKGASERLEADYRYCRKRGEWRWARQRGIALRDARGRATRLVGSIGDITELKRAEEARRRSDERYELAMRAINEGVYEWDIAAGTTFYSDRVVRAVGLSRRQLRNAADWQRRIHPEDRARFDAALVAHFKGRSERFECDFRYRGADGGWRWARQHGVAVRDADGRAVRMVGSTGDITELKRVEEALKASEERYALATRAATEGIYEWNLETGSLYLSDRAKVFFAVAGDALTPAAWNARVHGEDFQGYRDAIAAFFKGRKRAFEHEYRIRDAAGGYAWVLDRAVAVRDRVGRVTRLVGALSDITQRRQALERQTASAEVLKAIAASPTDVRPVLAALASHAGRLCGAAYVNVLLEEGELLRTMAVYSAPGGPPPDEVFTMRAVPTTVNGRAFLERRPVHVEDFKAVADKYPDARDFQRRFGFRTILGVPMLRGKRAIGTISIWRREVRPFGDEEIALIQTFAAQAVIAIENVRLFNETREALERQTATAEILSAISSSIADTRPVFDRIARNCEHLFGGVEVIINLIGADGLLYVAGHQGAHREHFERSFKGAPVNRESGAGRCILEKRSMQYPDIESGEDVPPLLRANCTVTGVKACMYAPLVWEDRGIGAIFVGRRHRGPFSEKEVALLKTFADQAVIAIQNARLFRERQERTEALTKSVDQLTALGEVGQAISSTLDLEAVLKTIVSRAVQLTGLNGGTIYEFDELRREFHLRAAENMPDELAEVYRRMPIRLGEGIVGGAAAKREPVQVPDIRDPSYQTRYRELLLRQGYRAILAVPLLREDQIIGALTVSRNEPGAFAPEVVGLLKTFATQSAVAIQNARLFREIAEKSRQLEEASRHKSQFLASMSHELRTPLNAILGFNEMILGQVYGEVPSDMKEPLEDIQKSGRHLLRLINNVLDLAKIEAGRMELALADYSVQDTVESVRSTLRPLAEAKGLELVASVPQDIPLAYGDGGRLAQCLMNLAGNSLKFTKQGRVEIAVQASNGQLTWRVSDTGIGIPPDKIETLFSEFRQTDATIASEYGGTGLGLSITKKFIEMHGGRIWVESELGRGSTFLFEVPLRAGT
jgi:PAS domain S-box-containing protein